MTESAVRTVVVGASSGLGRCIGVGMAERGARVAMLARRVERLDRAAADAGHGTVAIVCDVTDARSCESAISQSADALGGIDAVVYAAGVGPLGPIEATDADTWTKLLATNVIGASLMTAAVLPHLQASSGVAMYLSSVSASQTAPWPGLGPYAVSKAALDKLVDAWRGEHPEVGFTRLVVGDCGGGEGEAISGFADGWDGERAGDYLTTWLSRGYMSGNLVDVEQLVNTVDLISRTDSSVCMRSVTVAPR